MRESGDGAPLYTQHGRVERFSSGYWEYTRKDASELRARAARTAREAPRRPPAPVELPLPMASLESAAVVGRQFVAGVSHARCVCVCRTGAGLLGLVRVSPCVGVNVNMTHATTGATTLLRH